MIVNKIATHGTKNVAAASSEVLAANDRRRYASIHNSGSTGIWLALGATAVVGTGIYVPPNGGSFVLDGENIWRGAVNAICSVAGPQLVGTLELK